MWHISARDLQQLGGVNWEHIDRKDKDYFELGVTKITRTCSQSSDEAEQPEPAKTPEPAQPKPAQPGLSKKARAFSEEEQDYLLFLKSSGQVPAEHPPQDDFNAFLEASDQLTPHAVRAAEQEFNTAS